MSLCWQVAMATDTGKRRRINEDALLCREDAGVWLVADGMGGHDAGDLASKAIVHALAQVDFRGGVTERLIQFEDTLIDVNTQLRDYARDSLAGRTMGSTVVALLVFQVWGLCLWVGDSRLYRLRSGKLAQISRDHSMWQELKDRGGAEELLQQQADLRSVITRAVGGHPRLVMDVQLLDIQVGDRYLLCTDGLYTEIPDAMIEQLMQGDSVEQAKEALLAAALTHGGRDNISLIVIQAELK